MGLKSGSLGFDSTLGAAALICIAMILAGPALADETVPLDQNPAEQDLNLGGGTPIDLGEASVMPGTWLGLGPPFSDCAGVFTLAMRADLADPGVIVAEAGGALLPLVLKGRHDPTTGRLDLEPTGWRGQPGRDPFRLELTYLADRDMLVIDQIGVTRSCETLIAGRLDALPIPINTDGLLFRASEGQGRVARAQTLQALTDQDCLSYLDLFDATGGNLFADPEGMVQVLGVDLLRWEDKHALRYTNLVQACSRQFDALLRGTTDVGLARRLDRNRGVRGVVAPLNRPPSQRGSDGRYAAVLARIHEPLLRELLMARRLVVEGVLSSHGVAPPTDDLNPDGLLFTGFYIPGGHHLGAGFVPLRLAAEDCTRFYSWQADYETYRIGNYQIHGGLLDRDGLVRVFGKPVEAWTKADGNIVEQMRKESCPALVRTSGAAALREAHDRAEAANTFYGWQALETPPSTGIGAAIWPEVERLMRDVAANSANTEARVAAIEAAPATLDLIARIDEQLATITPPRGAVAPYLTDEERTDLGERLLAERRRTGEALADETLERIANFPPDVEGVRQGQVEADRMMAVFGTYGLDEARNRLSAGWAAAARDRVLALWPGYVAAARATLDDLAGNGLSEWRILADQSDTILYLSQYVDLRLSETDGGALDELRARRAETANAMLAGSSEALIGWARDLPPSRGANAALDAFEEAVAASGGDLATQLELRDAIAATRAAYNPLGFARPDIADALISRRWAEVSMYDLEDIAYLTTALRRYREECPNALDRTLGAGSAAAVGAFVMRLGNSAVRAAVSEGPRNQEEGMRMVMLFFHNVANQPGCRLDAYGNVVGCVSEEEFFAGQEFILTSGVGASDANRLLAQGCEGEPARAFLTGLAEYVARSGGGSGGLLQVLGFEEALRP
ncbi:hypothetical protein FP2506_17529 [Fulvimarina pelagi HTCC2506]|uniref:Uncharacterized protein n=1 Tax=Fulvimarina pelagi HTCC2506 TaxID=314231 RepID=Q0FY42_9HYPH|nr:hypothetical protein [Fulvimarina pelagi]EAU39900.1 hypothetical protein FP2506_17529 [Fulvimarina pelagi HTCC2506]